MNGTAGGNLQNVLSISTAANNRYLLHFNSLNSLTQWTAGIRLAMYEHATLQEAYTGSLIAGKGKLLNNIRVVMERSRFKTEDWARVRFGAGTPWRRCWCVITPPDEKEYLKAQKTLKKKNAYDRKLETPKGDIKFYDTRKVTKKTKPIATISDAYAAYAIYPQSKPLIDQSTLVKLEGLITVNATPQSTTEGFVFVMPEVHPAVTGFEMMLRWLFPVFDTFALYGRPGRLIADTLDQRGLMFAMPRDRRYGYLDTLDVSGLIHTEGSQVWSERQWRVELKKLTSYRMNSADQSPQSPLRERRNTTSRTSLPGVNRGGVRFDDDDSATHSTPVTRRPSPAHRDDSTIGQLPKRTDTEQSYKTGHGHKRSASDAMGYKRYQTETPSRLSYEANNNDYDQPPPPPVHGAPYAQNNGTYTLSRVASEPESPPIQDFEELNLAQNVPPVTPVANPPAFLHAPNSRPAIQPYQAPELRRANSAMDTATLAQLADATRRDNYAERGQDQYGRDPRQEVAIDTNGYTGLSADTSARKGVVNRLKDNQKLPTIPASPHPSGQIPSPVADSHARAPPPVPQHGVPSQSAEATEMPPRVVDTVPYAVASRGISPSRSIVRKPIPSRVQSPMSDPEANLHVPSSPSSVGGFSDQIIDEDDLERVLQGSPRNASIADSDSVDYASTKTPSPKKPVERPRTGRLKTVGDVTLPQEDVLVRRQSKLDTFHKDLESEQSGTVPTVDFGPTYVYKPTGRPTTSGTITPGISPAEAGDLGSRLPPHVSPAEAQQNSYFSGRISPGPNTITHETDRGTAWQPGTANSGDAAPRQTLTAEQWVQYRASLASQPVPHPRVTSNSYHGRTISSGNVPMRKPVGGTPPTSRNSSGDWTQPGARTPLSRSRNSSGDWTQHVQRTPPQVSSRPNSRNAGTVLGPSSPNGTSLNAREQMQIARMTGGPLINVPNKNQKVEETPSPGLVGALEARQRDKAAMKEGIRSGVVQHAIAARQQQEAQAAMEAQVRAQYQMQQMAHAQAYQFQQQAYANAANVQQQMYGMPHSNQRLPMQRQGSSQYQDQPPHLNAGGFYQGAPSFTQGTGWGRPGIQQAQSYGRSQYGGYQDQQR